MLENVRNFQLTDVGKYRCSSSFFFLLRDHNHQVDYFCRYGACWVCLCRHNPPNSDMDYRVFIVRTNVSACDCARGCTDTEKESALKVDSGKKIPCLTGESNPRQRCGGPMLYRLSYIPYFPAVPMYTCRTTPQPKLSDLLRYCVFSVIHFFHDILSVLPASGASENVQNQASP